MNKPQKIVVMLYTTIVFFFCFLYVPWTLHGSGGAKRFVGFASIWGRTYHGATLDIPILLTELFGVTVIAIVTFILLKRK